MTVLTFWPRTVGAIAVSSPLQTDPTFSSDVQLAHMEGGGNSCPRGNTMVAVGAAALSTTQKQWGAKSLRVPSFGSCIRGASHADYNFSTGDWTIEFWVRPDTLTRNFDSAKVYYDGRNASLTAGWIPTISTSNDTGNLRYFANGSVRISGADVMQATTWNYIALCRNSGTTRLFRGVAGGNATQVGSDFADSNTYVQCAVCVGAAGNDAGACIAYFDDLRVKKGVGLYTTTFAVPAGPFPNQ